jgi:hypothetical protein
MIHKQTMKVISALFMIHFSEVHRRARTLSDGQAAAFAARIPRAKWRPTP